MIAELSFIAHFSLLTFCTPRPDRELNHRTPSNFGLTVQRLTIAPRCPDIQILTPYLYTHLSHIDLNPVSQNFSCRPFYLPKVRPEKGSIYPRLPSMYSGYNYYESD